MPSKRIDAMVQALKELLHFRVSTPQGKDKPETLRFVVFHIADRKNREKILKYGLLPRANLKRRRIRFHDNADETLRPHLSRTSTFSQVDGNRLKTLSLTLGNAVPCHFAKPLYRPEVGPTDAFVWEKQGIQLDAWAIEREYLQQTPHLVCVGHWTASYFGGPVLLTSINQFVTFLENPTSVPRPSRYFPDFFASDLPNILRGRVKTAYLGPASRYRHLLNSSVFVLSAIPPRSLRVVEYGRLAELGDDPSYTYEIALP